MSFILTSISGNPISAASAGYAPTNSAEVSAIASSYAESAASGKLDSTAFNSADFYGTANESGFVDSAYVDSAVSGKQDSLTFAYDADSAISSINGSALAGGGGGGGGDYVEKSASEIAIGSANTASYMSFAQGTKNKSTDVSFSQGYLVTAAECSFMQGMRSLASATSFSHGEYSTAKSYSLSQGYRSLASGSSVAIGYRATASNNSFARGLYLTAYNTSTVFGTCNLSGDGSGNSGAAFVIGDGTASGARHDLMVVTKDGEITMFSSTADTTGTGILSSIRAISAAAGGGGVDSATVSAIASSYAESAVSAVSGNYYPMTGNPSAFALSSDVSATVDLVTGSSSTWNGVTAKMDSTAFQSAYASASATQATAQGVLYILIPDGV